MALKGKRMVVVKTTKMALKVNGCVKKEALELLFPLDLSFRSSYSSSYVGVFTNGVGVLPLNQLCRKEMAMYLHRDGGGGSTIPIIGASSLIDLRVVLRMSTLILTLIIHHTEGQVKIGCIDDRRFCVFLEMSFNSKV
ncbi:hypothetical protein H5410_061346 [Solanum commersonii]|uniref:Uncharacterized protein n=1 Tax=Solanum commersonii TaxID=4109 RepID=A0A9J5W8L5_SOLCO|nr:hypothetical protein H5410_061346 [Solanum commersonii]